MKQKTIKSFDGTNIYYVINRVQHTSEFIIFIHGAGSNHTVYTPFFAAFATRNFIALDLRNHGKSGRSTLEKITIQTLAKDIHTIMILEKIESMILIGNSLGATVALEIYKHAKKKIRKMVFFTLFSRRYIRFSWLFNILATLASIFVKPFSGKRKLLFSEYHKYPKRPVLYYPYLDFRGTPFGTVMKLVRELFKTPLYVYNVTTPTLVFVSTNDWSTKNGLLRSDCRDCSSVTLVDVPSNHVVLTREYDEAIRIVKSFLMKDFKRV